MHRHFWPSKFSFGDTCRSQADSDYHPNPNPNPNPNPGGVTMFSVEN